jgi:hypothetical protein
VDGAREANETGDTTYDFPLVHPLQTTTSGGSAFVAKLSADGSSLLYSTYLGGSNGGDQGKGIAVDAAGNAYITGLTASSDFPTVHPLQTFSSLNDPHPGQDWHAFVAEVNSSGSALVYSTYLGGSGKDVGNGIAVDNAGNAYVTGSTESTDFPLVNPLQTANKGYFTAFVTKVNAGGTSWAYSTYLGGSGGDDGNGIAVDSAGNAYVTGSTRSTDFPLVNPLQAAPGGAFVAKLNSSGTALVYSTYLGGYGDSGNGIAVDGAGNTYVTGRTWSSNFPTTAGALQTTLGSTIAQDAFVTKLNVSGSALLYSTYLGGYASDEGLGIAVDNTGNAYVTGDTQSNDFPTVHPVQPAKGGIQTNAFIAKIGLPGFRLSAPQTALAGTTFTLTVTALDENGQQDTGYRGTIHLTSSDGSAVLPPEYTFTAADNGQHAFQVTLASFGRQTITAIDSTGTITGAADVLVPQLPVASFDWRMAPHFGQDNLTTSYDPGSGTTTFTTGGDGLIDYPWEDPNYAANYVNGNDFLHPEMWKVYLDASSSTAGTALSYSWQLPAGVINLMPDPSSPVATVDFPHLGTYSVTLTVTDAYGQKSNFPLNVVVQDYLIVSIGDSYASGEGAPDQPQVLDAFGFTKKGPVWEDRRTHRSAFAAAAQAAQAIQTANPHASVTFISVAASGAAIGGGILTSSQGTEPPTGSGISKLEPQLQQVKDLIGSRTIDALLMSAGGNDVGFEPIIQDLVMPFVPGLNDYSTIDAQFQYNLAGLSGLYYDLNNAIHSTYQLPVKNIYITEYADPTHDANGGYSDFPGRLAGLDGIPGINAERAQWAHDNVLVPLNQAVQEAAQQFGWNYIGGIDNVFATHGVSAGDQRWFNSIEDSSTIQGPINAGTILATTGTLHPNYLGQQAIAQQIAQRILTGGSSIQGTIFDDLNRSGVLAPAKDPRLPGWTVYLDLNHDGKLDPGDPTTVTDLVDGTYFFSGLAAGSYVVRAVPPYGSWLPSTASVTADVFSNALDGPQVADLGFYQLNSATVHDSADGRPVTLTSPAGTTLANAQAVPNPSPGDAPGGVQFPVGFFAFQVQGLTPGGSTTVTLDLPWRITVNTYYRYGPTAANPTPHWYPFLFDGTTGAEIDNADHEIILHFVDGGRGDDDLAANGVVVDAGAPGLLVVPSLPPPVSAPVPLPAPPVSLYQRWVVRVWQDLFGLPANPGWVAAQVGRLEQGADPRRVVLDILSSTDFRSREVPRLYRSLLHSAAGRRALASALAFLAGGGTWQQLEAWLFASAEYFQHRAGGSGAGFLQALFHDVLGQGPDPGTVLALGGLLVDPSARWQAATIMLRSLPAEVHWLGDLFGRFLHVRPDGKSVRLYVSRLQRGVREEAVLADLLASPLYLARV